MSARGALVVPATDTEIAQLQTWAERSDGSRVALRSRIVLLAIEGCSARTIAKRLGVNVRTAALWRSRYVASGVHALASAAPGRGPKRRISVEAVTRCLAEHPMWSQRRVARELRISYATVHRIAGSSGRR